MPGGERSAHTTLDMKVLGVNLDHEQHLIVNQQQIACLERR